jgi:putative ABC transport system permease protein
MDSLSWDIRSALRSLGRRPGTAAIAVATLAVGIGVSTAVFCVIDGVLVRPLPFPESERLVRLWDTNAGLFRDRDRVSPGNLLDWMREDVAFAGVAAWHPGNAILRTDHDAEVVQSVKVTPGFFTILGVPAARGRTFAADELAGALYDVAERYRGGDRVLVLSDRLWRRRFGADPYVVGRTISLDDAPWLVAGVMPPGFAMPSAETDVWLPWDIPASYASLPGGSPRDWRFLNVVARLSPRTSLEAAQARVDSVAAALAEAHPKANRGWASRIVPLKDDLVASSRPALFVLLGAVGFVLLIACANVASLQLARAADRSREIAVRLALGARRSRLVRQLLTESLLIALGAGLAGTALAVALLEVLRLLRPAQLPRLDEIGLDLRVLAFAALAAIVAGVASGLAPALQATRTLASALQADGGRAVAGSAGRWRRALVVLELTVALVLLTGAGLLGRSFVRLTGVDPGFDPENLLVLRVSLDNTVYRGPQSASFYRDLTARLSALPGATSAGAVTALPLSDVGIEFDRPYWRERDPDPGGEAPKADIRMATTGYFDAMRMRLLRGRGFTDDDRLNTPKVVVLNETLARAAWPEADAVGHRIVIEYRGGAYPYEVVGIVNDTRHHGLRRRPRPEIFIPHAQNPYLQLNVVVRTAVPARTLAVAAARKVRALDPRQPVHSVVTMDELRSRSLGADRLSMVLLAALASVAVVLAATGVFGVLAHAVTRRTREIGTRVALGAGRGHVLRLVLCDSLRLAAAGAALGLAVSLALGRTLAGLLYGVGPRDPWTLGGVSALLVLVALVAAYVPARRALRIDPAEALRSA